MDMNLVEIPEQTTNEVICTCILEDSHLVSIDTVVYGFGCLAWFYLFQRRCIFKYSQELCKLETLTSMFRGMV